MKGAEKFILLSIERYERLLKEQEEKILENKGNYSEMDTEINEILQNKNLEEEKKCEAYRKVLVKWSKENDNTDMKSSPNLEMNSSSSNLEMTNNEKDTDSSENTTMQSSKNISSEETSDENKNTPPGVQNLDQIGNGLPNINQSEYNFFDGPPGVRDIGNIGKIRYKKPKKNRIKKWIKFKI